MALFGSRNQPGQPGLLARGFGMLGGLLAAPRVGVEYGRDRLLRALLPAEMQRRDADIDTEIAYRQAFIDRMKDVTKREQQEAEAAQRSGQALGQNRQIYDSIERYKAKWGDRKAQLGQSDLSPLLQNTQQQSVRNMARLGDADAAAMLEQGLRQQASGDGSYTLSPGAARYDAQGRIIVERPFAPRQSPEDASKTTFGRTTGKEDAEWLQAFPQTLRRYESTIANYGDMQSKLDSALAKSNAWTTGIGAATFKALPGSPQFDLAADLQSIMAEIGFDRLQRMRDESPTGGALGQVAVQELAALQNSIASLEQSQSKKEFEEGVRAVKGRYQRYTEAVQRAMREDTTRAQRMSQYYGLGTIEPPKPQRDAETSGELPQLPSPGPHKGRRIRDKESGQVYVSDGLRWIPEG